MDSIGIIPAIVITKITILYISEARAVASPLVVTINE